MGKFHFCMRKQILEYSGIEIRQFTHSAEIKREIPFCMRKQILKYSGIEIRQFTHSAEIKREIPFCTRKRSETYILTKWLLRIDGDRLG